MYVYVRMCVHACVGMGECMRVCVLQIRSGVRLSYQSDGLELCKLLPFEWRDRIPVYVYVSGIISCFVGVSAIYPIGCHYIIVDKLN